MAQQPAAPVDTMSHEDAKRSFLLQLQGFDKFREKVTGADVSVLSDEQADELFNEWAIRTSNLELTVRRIEETRPA